MGHAFHFLTRLERLRDQRHLDLALGLYRDPRAVRFALDEQRLPAGVERVAIALDSSRRPPHVIVARDGGFVTCLAGGMHVGDLPIIGRDAVEQAMALSQRTDRAEARIALRGGMHRLFSRLLEAGPRLAREDMDALQLMAPLFEPVVLEMVPELHDFIAKVRRHETSRTLKQRDARTERRLKAYAQATAAMGHLMMLLGGTGRKLAANTERLAPHGQLHGLTGPAFVIGEVGPMVRGAWLAAESGPGFEPHFRAQWQTSTTFVSSAQAALSLAAIAMRHPELRPAVIATLSDESAPVFDPERCHPGDDATTRLLGPSLLLGLQAPELIDEMLCRTAKKQFDEDAEFRGLPPIPLEELRLDECGPLLCTESLVAFDDGNGITLTAWLTIWAANRPAVDLYPPAALLDRMMHRASPDFARKSIAANLEYWGRNVPQRRKAPKVGRNDPCPCGSGQKFKRCCAIKRR